MSSLRKESIGTIKGLNLQQKQTNEIKKQLSKPLYDNFDYKMLIC